MSKFRGYSFKVFPESKQFPQVFWDGEFYRWNAKILIEGNSTLQNFRNLITVQTEKRPLGTISVVAHIEAGRTVTSVLEIPSYAGHIQFIDEALLTGLKNVSVYAGNPGGGNADKQYTCDVEFLIMSDPNT